MRYAPVLLAGILLPLAGCASDPGAPSLALRPVERQPVGMPVAASEPDSAADPALAAKLQPLLDAAAEGHAAFEKERRGTEASIAQAQGKNKGSEEWTLAQQALSALDAARGPVRDAAAAVEAIRQEPANAPAANRGAIEAAAAKIEAIEESEAALVAALTARLG